MLTYPHVFFTEFNIKCQEFGNTGNIFSCPGNRLVHTWQPSLQVGAWRHWSTLDQRRVFFSFSQFTFLEEFFVVYTKYSVDPQTRWDVICLVIEWQKKLTCSWSA